jgi:hypothetical protein
VLWRSVRALLAALGLWAACVYDADQPCGRGQVQNPDGYCVCAAGTVLDLATRTCQACPAKEREQGGRCVCEANHVRPAPREACVPGAPSRPAPKGQGQMCMSDADCAAGEAKLCDTMFLKQCLFEGCKPSDPTTCSDGYTCCDLTPRGLPKALCLPLPQCP